MHETHLMISKIDLVLPSTGRVVPLCKLVNYLQLFEYVLDIVLQQEIVPSEYTLLINTLYLCLSTQVVEGTVSRKQTVAELLYIYSPNI